MHPALAAFTFRRGNVVVRNRTVLAAMTNKQSHADGSLSDDEVRWLEARAKGGFGIITTAATHVHEHGQGWEGEFGTWSDDHIVGLKRLALTIRDHGAVGLAQLFHGGIRAPERLTGVQPASASINDLGKDLGKSRMLSIEEIGGLIEAFGDAAERCEKAGFHGVELHGAHGYLIAQFLGASTNRRTDRYGGTQTKRTRFLTEIVEEVRRRTGPDFLVGVRLSPELSSCGLTLQDSLETLGLCNDMALDFVHVSCWDIAETATIDGHALPYTTVFRSHLDDDIPLITTGSVWNAGEAQNAMTQGGDFVGVGRAGIGHPNWPKYLEEAAEEPKRPPFSVSELEQASLNPTFINYMRRWSGFVGP